MSSDDFRKRLVAAKGSDRGWKAGGRALAETAKPLLRPAVTVGAPMEFGGISWMERAVKGPAGEHQPLAGPRAMACRRPSLTGRYYR